MSEEQVHEDIINADHPFTEAEPEVEKEEPAKQQEESTIPEKYRGKSAEEIIEMHMNAEKELSRLGNDLGETRKIVDKLLQAEAFSQKPVQEEEDLDWTYEPDKAAQKLVEKEVGAVKQELDTLKQQSLIEKFKAKYPDFETDSASYEFQEWVKASPYRVRLYEMNYNGVDLDAASELMDGWNDFKSVHVTDTQNREQAMKDAAMEKSSSSGTSRKKVWSRAYIRDLMKNHPETYKKHYDEIMAAYREDRLTK